MFDDIKIYLFPLIIPLWLFLCDDFDESQIQVFSGFRKKSCWRKDAHMSTKVDSVGTDKLHFPTETPHLYYFLFCGFEFQLQ